MTEKDALRGAPTPLILIVDDDALSRRIMTDILTPLGYEVKTAKNGSAGVEEAGRSHPDLVFLDVLMPVMDGFEACRRIKGNPETEHIPVVLITALEDRESKLKGLAAGASDFLSKPVDENELALRVKNILRVKELENFLRRHNEELDTRVKERTLQLSEALEELGRSREDLKSSYLDTIFKLTVVAEYKDGFTASHISKVGHFCRLLAGKLGWPEEDREMIFYASPMHDIGKVGIPSEILLKPGQLTTEEFALMKTHTDIGSRILQGSSSRYLRMGEQIALTHHERWDGTGYPQGLRGDRIPRAGMIMNIADQYDAIRCERPYKPAFSHEQTVKIITEGDGRTSPGHFDPKVLEAFRDTTGEFNEIFEKYST